MTNDLDQSKAPPNCSEGERWIAHNPIVRIEADYRISGDYEGETYLKLTDSHGKSAAWKESTFRRLAEFNIGTYYIATARVEIKDKVLAREKYEALNKQELQEYKRLKDKFGGKGEYE